MSNEYEMVCKREIVEAKNGYLDALLEALEIADEEDVDCCYCSGFTGLGIVVAETDSEELSLNFHEGGMDFATCKKEADENGGHEGTIKPIPFNYCPFCGSYSGMLDDVLGDVYEEREMEAPPEFEISIAGRCNGDLISIQKVSASPEPPTKEYIEGLYAAKMFDEDDEIMITLEALNLSAEAISGDRIWFYSHEDGLEEAFEVDDDECCGCCEDCDDDDSSGCCDGDCDCDGDCGDDCECKKE